MRNSLIRAAARALAILAWAVLAGVGCNSPATPEPEPTPTPQPGYDYNELIKDFEYDDKAPLNIIETNVIDSPIASTHYLSYLSPRGNQVPAFLMIPKGSGPFPAVIFLHWGPGDKSEFNADATALAMAGVISLSIDAPFVRETWDHNKGDSMYIQTVLDLRRGADLLLARTDVDPSRLGFCGHSYGATWGGVLAGVDKRFKGFVLMAGDPEIGNCAACKEPASPKYWAIHYIGHASPAALLFQFARQDEYITKEAADKYYAAASDPKTVIWYDTNHAFNEQAQLDRLNWLKTLFGI